MRGRAFYIRVALIAALAVHAVATVYVIAARLGHPGDLEWMTGAVLDHMERMREGKPLYTAPSAHWIPLLYPPLYYKLGALLGGGAIASRLLSVTATIAQGVLVWSASRALRASRFWSAVSVLVFVASFSFVGAWYDLERSDNLFGAIVLTGSVILLRSRRMPGLIVAGLVLGVGAFAKQQAVFYVAGAGLGLLAAMRAKEERPRPLDVVAFGVAAALPLAVLNAYAFSGEGWAAYYLVRMPKAHGLLFGLAPGVFVRDVGTGFLVVGVTVFAALYVARATLRGTADRRDTVGAAILAAGFAGAVASRLHIGGWINVLIPWATCASVAVGVVASRVEERYASDARALPIIAGVIALQLVQWRYDPSDLVPRRSAAADERRLVDEVRALERDGDVLMPARGHITRARHFHISALADVARVDGHSPRDLVEGLKKQEYVAVIDDARYIDIRTNDWPPTILEDIDDLRPVLLASYYVARHIDYGGAPLALRAPATPSWVYLRRKAVLDLDEKELRKRQLAEMKLADKRARAITRGKKEPFAESDIEEMAAVIAAKPASAREEKEKDDDE